MSYPFTQRKPGLATVLEDSERRAMSWLLNAWSQSADGGFPHSRCCLLPKNRSWAPGYPETTGYLIENLLVLNPVFPARQEAVALRTGEWLCSIQHRDGWFFSGVRGRTPSAFNTSMILGGLLQLYQICGQEQALTAVLRSHRWLITSIADDGRWTRGLYRKDYFSAYYARALWLLALADQQLFSGKNRELLQRSFQYLFDLLRRDPFVNSGFDPGRPSLSHTLAYALEGIAGAGDLLGCSDAVLWVEGMLENINERSLVYGKIPASFGPGNRVDASYVLCAGQAQFASLFLKSFLRNRRPPLFEAGSRWLSDLAALQQRSNHPAVDGGFYASSPKWKGYFPWRMVNWTNKFFLDACNAYRAGI
ncbi:MAG: hypothetical protein KBF37_02055 [Saprospiraceae bacterium]|nr:hypothetical protein [Saprospiraceae bacterium]MBP9209080.1 hypothetical protein [Saprospiraceae bacterium]